MPRDHDLLGSYSGREESPEFELLLQEEIGVAIQKTLTSPGLYQKQKLNLEKIDNYLTQISSIQSCESHHRELAKRPWVPISPDVNQENYMRARHFCGIGENPLGTPQDEMPLHFPLPSIKLDKVDSVFLSIGSIWCDGLLEYFPNICENTEQVFTLYYRCSICKNKPITFLLARTACAIHLCGRSERAKIKVSKAIPKKLRPIVSDAISAAKENDIFAGFYHLRTFCEHYIKETLRVDIEEKMTGEDLCNQYNSSLSSNVTGVIPSLSSIYEEAGKYLQQRKGSYEAFNEMLEKIEDHLTAKELFSKYSK